MYTKNKFKIFTKYITFLFSINEKKVKYFLNKVFYLSNYDYTKYDITKIVLKNSNKFTFTMIKVISEYVLNENDYKKVIKELKIDGEYYADFYPFIKSKSFKHINSMKKVNFNDMMENYFMVRKMKNTKRIGKIYTEFLTYDTMAVNYYGVDYINKIISKLRLSKTHYCFSLYEKNENNIIDITTIKCMIGLISIISSHDKGKYPSFYIFFDEISHFKRKEFEKYICDRFP
ncbi:putative alpha amanitin-sensitive protein [Lumpy skin disease virus]|uniref:Alpha amanitin-sensitive protein n=1 Tax=Lumpy skin disease virus TaxID=59509 RepID=Q91MZ5_LSDV|nr:putative alpha aminitin-sensitive protein [Lumpy skin disease virus NI-2490]AAN02575.1 putative alpha amanitin-sensitive protein [Lumpy skin disease virus NW-LW]AOE47585.1 putative alpha aminitin-sensitive protein [Lumpy skin disease virus]AAK84970.1 LSDV009 putative alpha amanitin-sensitive protein [Lumpy skin disease virus NI-2490]ARO77316.1 putative alpha amanitin-sensitive protein [Lumpy skin disease virus]ART89333.1 putative alpha amanitin-sensitive protein [Lumpy skin disease virus]